MAPVPVEMFLDACEKVVRKNAEFVPPYGTGGSMYLRPLLIGTGPQIGVAPAKEYTFMIMVMPVGAYYKGGLKPVRAVIGGTHLVAFDADRAQRTAEWLSAKRIPTVAACHCTGPDASALFSQLGFAQAGGGYSITFGREESIPRGTAPSC